MIKPHPPPLRYSATFHSTRFTVWHPTQFPAKVLMEWKVYFKLFAIKFIFENTFSNFSHSWGLMIFAFWTFASTIQLTFSVIIRFLWEKVWISDADTVWRGKIQFHSISPFSFLFCFPFTSKRREWRVSSIFREKLFSFPKRWDCKHLNGCRLQPQHFQKLFLSSYCCFGYTRMEIKLRWAVIKPLKIEAPRETASLFVDFFKLISLYSWEE